MNGEQALAQLRHLYAQMLSGNVKDCETAAHGLLGPAIEALEVERRHITALENERDAALADNAAKTETIQRMRNLLLYPTMDADATRLEVLRLGLDAVTHPGPGAALLKDHRKALVRARNEGLEKAAVRIDWLAETSAGLGHANDAEFRTALAVNIRAMKEPESD